MDVKYKRADTLECGDVIIKNGEEVLIDSVQNVCGYIRINNDEALTPPEAQVRICKSRLSDLEIVQKALEQEHCFVEITGDGGWHLFERITNESIGIGGDTVLGLLTWAKQQIGVE